MHKLLLRQYSQNIRLIFERINCTVQLDPARSMLDLGVVPGRHCVKTQSERAVKDGTELDFLVAAQTRVWSSSLLIFRVKVIHHAFGEFRGKVPDIKRDSKFVCNSSCISSVVEGATSTALPV
jgi:hypothetical protein